METQPVVRKTSTKAMPGHKLELMETQLDMTKVSTMSIAETTMTTTGTTQNKVLLSGLRPELQDLYDSECELDCEMLFQELDETTGETIEHDLCQWNFQLLAQ